MVDKKFNRKRTLWHTKPGIFRKIFSSITQIYKSQQVVEGIAYDVKKHYCNNYGKEKDLKAMLAVPLKNSDPVPGSILKIR